MDSRYNAQDVHRCDLCETAVVDSYCDICDVNLCSSCIGKHILDGYDKHTIVPFRERRSTLIYPKCKEHSQRKCELQCKDCGDSFVCLSCTASELHIGHRFVDVKKAYKMMKDAIKKDAEELEIHISPVYDEYALDLMNQLTNLDGEYEKVTTAISKKGEEWHKEIDYVVERMENEISNIKVKHREDLQKQLDEIKQLQSLMKQTLLTLREIQESTDVSFTIEYNSKITEFSKSPTRFLYSMPTFIPKLISHVKIYSYFGEITPLRTTREEPVVSAKPENTLGGELLGKPELKKIIQTGYEELRSVACHNEDRIWTTCGKTNDIKCFNIKSFLLHTIKSKSGKWPNDLALDKEGNLLFSEGTRRTVNIIKNGESEELIRVQGWMPNTLCVTSSSDLLVSMYNNEKDQSKVVRYTGSTEKQTIQFDDEGKPLYSGNNGIKYITVNKNGDICVSDCKAGAVVIVDKAGNFRCKYAGYPSRTKKSPFKPFGITADSQNRVLIVDRSNHCIHILDGNGDFLRFIDNCNLMDPWGLCVDDYDNLFVCEFYKGYIKKIKYC
ncbi:uncharacterized protein LOC128160519 [Crassostrea angulata]|uniref:uncharacterized protein LOC128160519 n=1 Tax=Magallana angulata TaxID=2784310 RepID=UPI0022B0FACC|nr:uncharacterized protein LOC128160519 [Crassostrea angulata]